MLFIKTRYTHSISADEFMVILDIRSIGDFYFKREMRNVRQIRNKKKYQ